MQKLQKTVFWAKIGVGIIIAGFLFLLLTRILEAFVPECCHSTQPASGGSARLITWGFSCLSRSASFMP